MGKNLITIFLDTNYLYMNEIRDFTSLACFVKTMRLIEELEANDLYEGVKIVLSELSLAESIEHQVQKYDEIMNKIKDKDIPNVTCSYDKNYREYLNKLSDTLDEYFSGCQISVDKASFPEDTCLKSIILRSIMKCPPFEGKEKKSDKGFKDVVLWESIKEYKRANHESKIILLSNDTRLACVSDEFKHEFSDQIYIHNKIEDLLSTISEIMKKEYKAISFERGLVSELETLLHVFDFDEVFFDCIGEFEGEKVEFSNLL